MAINRKIFDFAYDYPFPYKCPWCGGWNETEEISLERNERYWICRGCGIRTFTNYNPRKRRYLQLIKAQTMNWRSDT